MLDNKVLSMTPGEALLDAPVGDFVEKMGIAIARAQLKLDQTSVEVATLMGETKLDFTDSEGKTRKMSLLELGFTPTFYQFTETEIEVKLAIHLKVEETEKLDGSGRLGNSLTPFGASLSIEQQRKFEFDMSGSSSVKTRLLTVPPPRVFLEVIQENARAHSTPGANPT